MNATAKMWQRGTEIYDLYLAEIDKQIRLMKPNPLGTEYDVMGGAVYAALIAKFGIEKISAASLLPFIIDGVRSECDLRCIEKANEDQLEMWGEPFLDAVIKIDSHSVTKVRHATASILKDADKRKFANVRKVNSGYAKWRERLDTLLTDGGMDQDTTLTVEAAIKNIKQKGKGDHKQSAGRSDQPGAPA